jgi:hypothetical protein
MLKNFKDLLKVKGRVTFFKLSGVTCLSQGLFIDITAKHLKSGETVPLRQIGKRKKYK